MEKDYKKAEYYENREQIIRDEASRQGYPIPHANGEYL